MFDKSGGKGDKQDAVNGAAMTAMKLLVKSKLGGSPVVGGSNSGGLGGLLSLVSDIAKPFFVPLNCNNSVEVNFKGYHYA